MNFCLAKWIIPCLAPLFRFLGSVYQTLLSSGLFQLVTPTICFNKPLSSDGRPLCSDIPAFRRYATVFEYFNIIANILFHKSTDLSTTFSQTAQHEVHTNQSCLEPGLRSLMISKGRAIAQAVSRWLPTAVQ
jgi:hypothetical protein